jgi:hypothetical protein
MLQSNAFRIQDLHSGRPRGVQGGDPGHTHFVTSTVDEASLKGLPTSYSRASEGEAIQAKVLTNDA